MPSRAVLITGAAGGLGAVMAAALLKAGHAVAAVDRNAAALARLPKVVSVHVKVTKLAPPLGPGTTSAVELERVAP